MGGGGQLQCVRTSFINASRLKTMATPRQMMMSASAEGERERARELPACQVEETVCLRAERVSARLTIDNEMVTNLL